MNVTAEIPTLKRLEGEVDKAADTAGKLHRRLATEAVPSADSFGSRPASREADTAWRAAVGAVGWILLGGSRVLAEQAEALGKAARGYLDADAAVADSYRGIADGTERPRPVAGDPSPDQGGSGKAPAPDQGGSGKAPAPDQGGSGKAPAPDQGGGKGAHDHGGHNHGGHNHGGDDPGPPRGENGALPADQLSDIGGGKQLSHAAARAFSAMENAALRDGVDLSVNSAYRSAEEQEVLYQRFLNGTGARAAPPGSSNHGLGLSVDINVVDDRVLDWLHRNAGKYGYVNDVEGEPWHWTYYP